MSANGGGSDASAANAVPSRASVTMPHIMVSARMPTPIHTPRRHRVTTDVATDARRYPQQSDCPDREQRRDVLGSHIAREAPSRNSGHRHTGQVVADDDARQCTEQKTFDQSRRGCEPVGRADRMRL